MLFESLSLDDSQDRVAGRKAAAVAVKRAKDQFAVFLSRATSVSERQARLALIDDDVMRVVAAVAREYGADPMRLDRIVRDALTGRDRVAKFVEARRPKMCPYHREVMDISLASGEPTAGFSTMAQHAWGQKHCQGEWEGSCNFRREMVTQAYWDKKAEEAAERAQERQQFDVQDGIGSPLPDTVEQPEEADPEPVEVEAPEAPEVEDSFGDFSMAASRRLATTPLTPELAQALEICHQNGYAVMGPDGNPIGAFNQDTAVGPQNQVPPQEVLDAQQQQYPTAATKMAEALTTVDVTKGGETPSPKMDKRKWTPQNVKPVDTDSDGSPHPTRDQDVTEAAKYEGRGLFDDDDRLAQTEAVTEHNVDVTQGSETKAVPGPTKGPYTWSGDGGQADPVTSEGQSTVTSAALDVDKNPLREILEGDFGGFVPTNVVQQAVASYQRKQAYMVQDDYDPADSGGYLADPMGRPGQPEWDDPNGPYYDPPCPKCGAREGAFEGGHCMACGHQEAPGGHGELGYGGRGDVGAGLPQQGPGLDDPRQASQRKEAYGEYPSPGSESGFGTPADVEGHLPGGAQTEVCQHCGDHIDPATGQCIGCGQDGGGLGPHAIPGGPGPQWSDPIPRAGEDLGPYANGNPGSL